MKRPDPLLIIEEDMARLMTLPETGRDGEHPDFPIDRTDTGYVALSE